MNQNANPELRRRYQPTPAEQAADAERAKQEAAAKLAHIERLIAEHQRQQSEQNGGRA
ncbi:MAG: hypothetical protein HIU89_10205 [Proteobacteria bacterium]|nr:hypothetical protein [Pseudomonadota bacterium]